MDITIVLPREVDVDALSGFAKCDNYDCLPVGKFIVESTTVSLSQLFNASV